MSLGPLELDANGMPTIVSGPEFHWLKAIMNMSAGEFNRLRAKHALNEDHPVFLAYWHRKAKEIEERSTCRSPK